MYTIYQGTGPNRRAVGQFEDDTVYSTGESGRRPIGEIELGVVYAGTGLGRRPVGQFDDRVVYSGVGENRAAVGEIEGGTIYRGIGPDRVPVGQVEPASRRAGSALLLLLNSHLPEQEEPEEVRDSSPVLEVPMDLAAISQPEPAPAGASAPGGSSDRKYRVVQVQEYKMIGPFGVGELIALAGVLLVAAILGYAWLAS